MNRPWARRYEALGLLLGALMLAALACFQAADVYWLRTRGEVVTGTVVEREHSPRQNWIEVRYVTRAGETLTQTTSSVTVDDDLPPGAKVDVIYDPQKPERMQTAAWDLGFGWVVIGLGIASLVFAAGGVASLYRNRKVSSR
jgi:uncharacterized protein DUF3592